MSIKMNAFSMAIHVMFIEKPLEKPKRNSTPHGFHDPIRLCGISNDHYEQLDGCEVEPNGIFGTDEGDYYFDWD